MFGSIGTVSEFEATDDWKLYQERLEQYFLANGIEEGRKIPVVGLNTYKIIKDLSDLVLPKDRPYTEICELLDGHFSPAVPIFRKRIEFYNLRQSEGETCGNWYCYKHYYYDYYDYYIYISVCLCILMYVKSCGD